jgi:thiol-disulfide isomerase/thioredoxin
MKYIFLLCFSFLSFSAIAKAGTAPTGHDIKVKLDNYDHKILVLGFYYGEKTYVKDTADIDDKGWFTFKADTLLPCGMYLLVLQPDNNFIQFAMGTDDQEFSMTVNAKDPVNTLQAKGSKEVQEFYEYMRYLGSVRPIADSLRADFEKKRANPADSISIIKQLDDLDKRVKAFQAQAAARNKGTVVGKIILAAIEPEAPEFKGPADSIAFWRYYYVKEHFFDNIDIADPCLLRGPVMHQKVDYYINKLTPQHPDSINLAIDYILEKTKNSPDVYKYWAIHFLNEYAKSQIVGFDACYVHVGKKYYCGGKCTWTTKEDLDKICENVGRLEPILMGKIAPNIMGKTKEGQPVALYDVDADYTVLFFWAPDCSHCKKAAPHVVEFYNKYKSKGVKILSFCTAVTDQGPECWKGVEEKGFNDLINISDPYIQSKYKTLYDVRTTPQVFILDRKHEILMKRISPEQLSEVMEQVMKMEERKVKEGKK